MPWRGLWVLLLVSACSGGGGDTDLRPPERDLPSPLAGAAAPLPAAKPQLPAAVPSAPAPRPPGWPLTEGFAGSSDSAGYRCASDDGGNWVCALDLAGTPNKTHPGPCAFGPQGELVASWQTLWSDIEASAIVTQFDSRATPRWTRIWNRNGGYPTHTIGASDMRVHPDGRVVWAGRDCVPSSQRPAARNPGYYKGSCIDGYVATLDSAGDLLWDLWLGTRDGIDDVSDLALAPDGGVYVAGGYQPPFSLPGLLQDSANGSIDFYVLALDRDGAPRWAQRLGSPEHEGDRLSLAATPQGLAVHGNLTPFAGAPGIAAMLDLDGGVRWLTEGLPHSLGDTVWLAGEVLIPNGNQLLVLNERGELQTRSVRVPAPYLQMSVTPQGTLMLWSTGSPLVEMTSAGQVLRQYSVGDSAEIWYYGGMCVSADGAVAITGNVGPDTHFDFLREPFDLPLGAAFVMHLADWKHLSQ